MNQFLDLNNLSLSSEVLDYLSPADVCDDQACGDGSVNSMDYSDGYLTLDEAELYWGSVGSFQKALRNDFNLFADFDQGELVPVGGDIYRLWLGERNLHFARDDMPIMQVIQSGSYIKAPQWTQESMWNSKLITILTGVNVEASIDNMMVGGLDVGFRMFYEMQQQQETTKPSTRINHPINLDIPNERIDPQVANDGYRGTLSNDLQFTVVDYDPSPSGYEYIKKVPKDKDTGDGVAEEISHGNAKTEDFIKVRKITIVFNDQGEDLKFEGLREITLHAGPGWTEWFVYKGFIYQLTMNVEPEKLALRSFPQL